MRNVLLKHDSLWRSHADGESFFENLPQAELPAPQVSRTSTLSPRPITAEEHHAEAGESEGDIQRALYVGNYEAAVTTCLQVAFHAYLRHSLFWVSEARLLGQHSMHIKNMRHVSSGGACPGMLCVLHLQMAELSGTEHSAITVQTAAP